MNIKDSRFVHETAIFALWIRNFECEIYSLFLLIRYQLSFMVICWK